MPHVIVKLWPGKSALPKNKKAGRRAPLPAKTTADSSVGDLRDVGGLGTFRALNDLKFDWVSFLQGAVTVTGDGGIVHKNVRSVIAADEAIPFGVIKPFHSSLHFTWPPSD